MKTLYISLALLSALRFQSCTTDSTNEQSDIQFNSEMAEYESAFSKEQIAAAAIAALMQHPVSIVKSELGDDGIYYTSYTSPSSGELYENRVIMNDKTIMWATKTGRWRDHELDEQISYKVKDSTLTIKQLHSDGSRISTSFSIDEFNLTYGFED
jgi:hypothetical protein